MTATRRALMWALLVVLACTFAFMATDDPPARVTPMTVCCAVPYEESP